MKKILVLIFAALLQISAYADAPLWVKYGKTFKVEGNPNIESFVKSLFQNNVKEWGEDTIYDKKNGYFWGSTSGDVYTVYNVCYWNRKDGKKLVIMSYNKQSETDAAITPKSSTWGYMHTWPSNDTNETGFRAYLYDEAKHQLTPLDTPPFEGWTSNLRTHYFLLLPRVGKDINICEESKQYEHKYHTLKWNGMTFNFIKENKTIFEFYRTDKEGEATNLRDAPNGKVVGSIPAEGEWCMSIDKIVNGWCHIFAGNISSAENEDETIITKNADLWIHSSVIGASGMGDGKVKLYASPSNSSSVVFESTDWTLIHPVEINGEWIKVKVDGTKKEGWIHLDEICSNPLTNCC